jgi:hypothetical protein
VRFRAVLFRFAPARYLRFRFRVLTASSAVALAAEGDAQAWTLPFVRAMDGMHPRG